MAVSEVIFLLDRSGSMQSIKKAVVKGINDFIADVNKTEGDGYWSLYQFDTMDYSKNGTEQFPHPTFEKLPNKKVPIFEEADFHPRGGTALVDAVCMLIQKTKDRLKNVDPAKRPKIMFVIITDGQENSSTQYTSVNMRADIAEVETSLEWGWKFLYLGANQDAFSEAAKHGIVQTFNFTGLQGVTASGQVATGSYSNMSAMPFDANTGGVAQAMASGSVGVRAWKAEGNLTALGLLGNADPVYTSVLHSGGISVK